jgi:hypothetical protein
LNLTCFEWEPPFAGALVDLVDRRLRVSPRDAVNPQYHPVPSCLEAVYPLHAEEFPEGMIRSAGVIYI